MRYILRETNGFTLLQMFTYTFTQHDTKKFPNGLLTIGYIQSKRSSSFGTEMRRNVNSVINCFNPLVEMVSK